MFGKILHETGAVDQIAVKMLKSFGHSRAHYAIGLAGLICALPLFFEVAIVLLISVAFSMARHTGTNPVKLVIPLFAGVAAAAAFLLPGPAPMLLASQMHADFGWMILIGLCAAIPGMIIAGPLWGISSAVTSSCTYRKIFPSRIWAKAKCHPLASAYRLSCCRWFWWG